MRNTRLLMLDEPTAALDAKNEHALVGRRAPMAIRDTSEGSMPEASPIVTTAIAPAPALTPYVVNYWFQTAQRPGLVRERILPSGSSELVIDMTADRIVPILIGPRTTPLTMQRASREAWVGVHFRAGGAGVLLGTPERGLAEARIAVDQIATNWSCDWADLIADASTPRAIARALDAVLLRQLQQAHRPRASLSEALAAFTRPDPVRSIGEVVKLSGLSSRRFITLFSDHTGFTPKVFARLLRFGRAVQTLHRDPGRGGADAALACGYFDQSHMSRDFRAFAGITPGRYAAAPTCDPFHVAEP